MKCRALQSASRGMGLEMEEALGEERSLHGKDMDRLVGSIRSAMEGYHEGECRIERAEDRLEERMFRWAFCISLRMVQGELVGGSQVELTVLLLSYYFQNTSS